MQSWPTCELLIRAPQTDQILSTVLWCTVVTILTWAAFLNLQKLCNTNILKCFTNASRNMSSSFQVSTHTHVITDSHLLWCGAALMGKFHLQSWPILGPHLLYTQACQHPLFTHRNSFNLPPLAKPALAFNVDFASLKLKVTSSCSYHGDGPLLTCSIFTHPKVSSVVSPGSFCSGV